MRPPTIVAPRTMRLAGLRMTNSKNSRINGIAKAATMIPMIVKNRPARSGVSGRESQ